MIFEVEELAAKLRERLWRLRLVRANSEAYLELAKGMSKEMKKYYKYRMMDAKGETE